MDLPDLTYGIPTCDNRMAVDPDFARAMMGHASTVTVEDIAENLPALVRQRRAGRKAAKWMERKAIDRLRGLLDERSPEFASIMALADRPLPPPLRGSGVGHDPGARLTSATRRAIRRAQRQGSVGVAPTTQWLWGRALAIRCGG